MIPGARPRLRQPSYARRKSKKLASERSPNETERGCNFQPLDVSSQVSSCNFHKGFREPRWRELCAKSAPIKARRARQPFGAAT